MPDGPTDRLDTELTRIRALARRDPREATRTVSATTITDPVVLAVLRAELLLRFGQPVTAAQQGARAVRLAAGGPLEMLAVTAFADLACITGGIQRAARACARLQDIAAYQLALAHPQAYQHPHGHEHEPEHCQQVCDSFRQALPQLRLARILTAVTTYHTDCHTGRAQLHRMHCTQTRLNGASPLATVLDAGLTTMDNWRTLPLCGPAIVTRPLAAVPGGLLQPEPTVLSTTWLTDRIRARACAGTHHPHGTDSGRHTPASSIRNPT